MCKNVCNNQSDFLQDGRYLGCYGQLIHFYFFCLHQFLHMRPKVFCTAATLI